jgi:hypothetical protein
MTELHPSAQRCLPRFSVGIFIFKRLTARRLYKSFGVKGLRCNCVKYENVSENVTLKSEIIKKGMYIITVYASQKTKFLFITKTKWIYLFENVIVGCYEQ